MRTTKKTRITVLCFLFPFAMLLFLAPAHAGDTLLRIKERKSVRCGVSDGIPGFSFKGPDGRWTGMDVEFCNALASAVLGDPAKVEFIPLPAVKRFPSLKAGEIDVLVRNTTWTLEREATLQVMFVGVFYYDGQQLLVPAKSGVKDVAGLNGASICVVNGTTHEANLVEAFRSRNLSHTPLTVESQGKAAEALFAGRCQAFTSEFPQLKAMQLRAPGGPGEYTILPEQISKEPMGPVVRRGDDEWFTLVRWVLFSLIRAEETGLTRSNVRARIEAPDDPAAQRWRELDGTISKSLTIAPRWAVRAVESVGNYGEMFERNLGAESDLKLERGLNRLWSQGGLLYSPPFR